MEEKLQRTVVTFLVGGLIVGFCTGVLLVTNLGLFMEQNEIIENKCVFEVGENVTTSHKYYYWNSDNFSGTIIDIRYDEHRTVLSVYNFTTDEIKFLDETWLADYGKKRYEMMTE